MRFGRSIRIASLDHMSLPSAWHGRRVDPGWTEGVWTEGGEAWEVAVVATSLGVQPLFGRRTDELSGGQAKRWSVREGARR